MKIPWNTTSLKNPLTSLLTLLLSVKCHNRTWDLTSELPYFFQTLTWNFIWCSHFTSELQIVPETGFLLFHILPQSLLYSMNFYMRTSFFNHILPQNFLLSVRFTWEPPSFGPTLLQKHLFSSRFYFRILGDNKDFLSVKFEFRTSSSGRILPQNPIVLVNFTSEPPHFLQILPQNSLVSIRFYIRTPYLLSVWLHLRTS